MSCGALLLTKMNTTHSLRLQVDNTPDAYGYFTLRHWDGTTAGNIDVDPVATVYDASDADKIVSMVNSHAALLEALETLCDQLDAYTRHPAFNDESHPLTVDWSHARQALALAKEVQS